MQFNIKIEDSINFKLNHITWNWMLVRGLNHSNILENVVIQRCDDPDNPWIKHHALILRNHQSNIIFKQPVTVSISAFSLCYIGVLQTYNYRNWPFNHLERKKKRNFTVFYPLFCLFIVCVRLSFADLSKTYNSAVVQTRRCNYTKGDVLYEPVKNNFQF